MFNAPTVVVLGAGSSVDFGMPVGSKLAAQIRDSLSFEFDFGRVRRGDEYLVQQLKQADPALLDRRVDAARRLALVLQGFASIDDCLYTHGGDEDVRLVGKAAIARAIALKENGSWLRGLWQGADEEVRENAFKRVWGTWAQELVRIAATGLRASDRRDLFRDLTLVTFNYDRCAETVLFHAVKGTFAVDEAEAGEIMKSLKVFRPYGGLGDLPWAGRQGEAYGTPSPDLLSMSKRIFVYTEDLGERPDLVEMRNLIASAGNIIFLGFGFHSQNVSLLKPTSGPVRRRIFATATSEHIQRAQAFRERIHEAFGGGNADIQIPLPKETCDDLLRTFGIRLAA